MLQCQKTPGCRYGDAHAGPCDVVEFNPFPASTTCGAVGALMVGGRVVGQVRCELDAGHADRIPLWHPSVPGEMRRVDLTPPVDWVPATPHAMTLEWMPEAEPDLDLFDPDEHFDAEVPIVAPTCSTCGGEHGLLDPCRWGA